MHRNNFLLLVTILFLSACSAEKKLTTASLPPYQPESPDLFREIVRLDSIFFDSYNTCKLEVFAAMVDEDLEFYHDRGGLLTSKEKLVESIKNNICNKVRRELLEGSNEVYPVPGYGAIQLGAHRFHNLAEASTSRYARFMTIWKHTDGKWTITRVVSLH
jgi:hypothetical protein